MFAIAESAIDDHPRRRARGVLTSFRMPIVKRGGFADARARS
jgi:hypothetical protein